MLSDSISEYSYLIIHQTKIKLILTLMIVLDDKPCSISAVLYIVVNLDNYKLIVVSPPKILNPDS